MNDAASEPSAHNAPDVPDAGLYSFSSEPITATGFSTPEFVSRAGLKLHAALHVLGLSQQNFSAADLGSNVGGFVQCLLLHGASRVYAVDTGYGVLAWKLRKDPRVVVMERVNALHVRLPEPVDVVTVDTGWTRQEKILPVAAGLLKPGGFILSLIKPHYESTQARLQKGVLTAEQSRAVLQRVLEKIAALNLTTVSVVQSPLVGQGGNVEYIAYVRIPLWHKLLPD